jgi:hypothetical protein
MAGCGAATVVVVLVVAWVEPESLVHADAATVRNATATVPTPARTATTTTFGHYRVRDIKAQRKHGDDGRAVTEQEVRATSFRLVVLRQFTTAQVAATAHWLGYAKERKQHGAQR